MLLAFDSAAWISVGAAVAAGVAAALASVVTVALAAVGQLLSDGGPVRRRLRVPRAHCLPRQQRYWPASALAVVLATLLAASMGASNAVIEGAAIGAVLGAWLVRGFDLARRPCVVALLGSGMGVAVMSAGIVRYLSAAARVNAERMELYSAVFIGAMIFATSAIAFCKLRGALRIDTTRRAGHGVVNVCAMLLCAWLGYGFVTEQAAPFGLAALLAMSALASALGVHLMIGANSPRDSRADAWDHVSSASALSARCEGAVFICRRSDTQADQRRLLAQLEWHGGDEPGWTLNDTTPRAVRTSAYRHRRGGNRSAPDCASGVTRRRAGAFSNRIASRATQSTGRD